MKKTLLIVMLFLAAAVRSDELVSNGGFERGLAPWRNPQRIANRPPTFTISQQTRFGKTCLRLAGDPQSKYNSFNTLVQDVPRLDRRTCYVLRFQGRPAVRTLADQSVKVSVRQIDSRNSSIVYTEIPLDLTGDAWRSYRLRFRPHPRSAAHQIYVIGSDLQSEDTVFLDDISLKTEAEPAAPFDPGRKTPQPVRTMAGDQFQAGISQATGLLSELTAAGIVLQPAAEDAAMVFVRQGNQEMRLDGKGTIAPDGRFRAWAEYGLADGFFQERITIEALVDIDQPVKLGVRHGFVASDWKRIVNALRPLRIIGAEESTIYCYGEDGRDLCLGELDQYQHTVYPMAVLENDTHWLLTGSRNLDGTVTLSPNHPAGYFPSVQKNPRIVRKGDRFRFELVWKLFSKRECWLRDVWRHYTDHLRTGNRELAEYVPPRLVEERVFYPGLFGSHTYFAKEREDRLPDGSSVWFFSWHDNISERYPIAGSWWSAGNLWKRKLNAVDLKKYVDHLQDERHFNLVFYLRQLANLRQRGKEFPDDWFGRTPGGALHLYGGGYEVKLTPQVAAEVGYDTLPLGHFNFANPEYRKFFHQEVFKVIDYYRPRAIGWDMGGNLDEFLAIASTYRTIRRKGYPVKVVANEGAGPVQAYSDMMLLENGLLGGKSPYDFEIVKAYATAVVCLERFNLMDAAVDNYLDGRRTWLSDRGLAENRRFLDYQLKRNPQLKDRRRKLSALCQIRFSLYDLSMGASPGYLEEAGQVPASLLKMAAEVNGMYPLNKSFAIRLANGLPVHRYVSTAAWLKDEAFRLAVHNDGSEAAPVRLLLDRRHLAEKGWRLQDLDHARIVQVSPDGETEIQGRFTADDQDIVLQTMLPAFSAVLVFSQKREKD